MDTNGPTNRLAYETSPYLKQHALNPVAWQPWDDAALRAARDADKPILLSVGYSACHWCHVMAHESFEDAAVAAVMNRLFLCIKVDREERPDLDRVYQAAHNLLARRAGGWPLTMFLAPDDLTPFFGGTYFPKEPRFGLPAFPDLLVYVERYFREHRAELTAQGPRLREILAAGDPAAAASEAMTDESPADRAVTELKGQFDTIDGGFGGAPKFPHPGGVRRLLLAFARHADQEARSMARASLHAMADRGLFDHLEGGFFRYSVDARWHIPHFEKMLYDNAQLIPLYAEAFVATGDARFRDVAIAAGDFVRRDMEAPQGGYYATLDADSGGEEGAFYLWQRSEFEESLDPDEAAVAIPYYGLDRAPNFEGHAYHLMIATPLADIATRLALSLEEATLRLARARDRLIAVRAHRVRPGRDDKILTAWNGLMIKGLARAGRLLRIPRFIDSACRACDRMRTDLWDGTRLAAVTKDGRTSPYGYLDDYAFLLDGILELMATRWREGDLMFAQALADVLLADFADHENGGFYFTASDQAIPLYRPKSFSDDALPSGNAVAASALLRLAHLLADPVLETFARKAVDAGLAALARHASLHAALIEAFEDASDPPAIIVLRGTSGALAHWHERAQAGFAPRRAVYAIPADAQDLPPGLAARAPSGAVVAYACQGLQCEAPVTDDETFDAVLRRTML